METLTPLTDLEITDLLTAMEDADYATLSTSAYPNSDTDPTGVHLLTREVGDSVELNYNYEGATEGYACFSREEVSQAKIEGNTITIYTEEQDCDVIIRLYDLAKVQVFDPRNGAHRTFLDYTGNEVLAPDDHKNVLADMFDGAIVWSCTAHTHRVRYCLEVQQFAGGDRDIQAAHRFGECVRHYLECLGKIND